MMKMLKRLRRQFVATTVILVGLILIAVLVAYCYATYQSAYSKIQMSLSQAVEKSAQMRSWPDDGSFPEITYTDDGLTITFGQSSSGHGSGSNGSGTSSTATGTATTTSTATGTSGTASTGTSSSNNGASGGNGGSRIDVAGGTFTPVYSVTVDSGGDIISVNDSSVTMDSSVAAQAISEAMASGQTSGLLKDVNLYYKLTTSGSKTYISFTDSTTLFSTLNSTILTSLAIFAGALLLVLLVAILLARMAIRPVEEAWTKQRRFIADASHELKTPLTVILANTEIVRENQGTLVAEQDKWLQGTLEESEKMEDLIQDLLMVAQTEEDTMVDGSAKAEPEPLDLSNIVEASAMQFEAVAYEQNVTMDYDEVEPHLEVKADKTNLERLVRILIDNACKYAGDPGNVVITLKREGRDAVYRVANTGENISADDLPHVFDRFFRSDTSRTDETGHGLGLSIAKNIAEGLRGTISVTSDPGEMTAFTVKLPLA